MYLGNGVQDEQHRRVCAALLDRLLCLYGGVRSGRRGRMPAAHAGVFQHVFPAGEFVKQLCDLVRT